MKYEVTIPIDGFENEKEFFFQKLDDFFSTITGVENEKEIKLMSFGALKNIIFTLPDEFISKLEIDEISDISIYYVFVLQTNNNDNSLNTFSPIVLNNKKYKMGQIHLDANDLGLENFDALLPKL
ncbi:flagellar assembly protein FliW [Arcobacter peruensis]|uniref:flagellar assembly protein FliW n=1 Tax=Arcobacter peruensis TaxID=2320140 RepID=UPI000F09927B|nr:flagellar assembly protein FliW [Arcobacter peruensis]